MICNIKPTQSDKKSYKSQNIVFIYIYVFFTGALTVSDFVRFPQSECLGNVVIIGPGDVTSCLESCLVNTWSPGAVYKSSTSKCYVKDANNCKPRLPGVDAYIIKTGKFLQYNLYNLLNPFIA